MLKGIAYALAACFIWGLIFVVPGFMKGFHPFEVALGRYFFFGLFSLPIFLTMMLRKEKRSYSWKTWLTAFKFTLFSSFIYYTCLVIALEYATPAISALILGVAPIAISIYGNWKEREVSFKSLILPSVLIFLGLVVINIPHFHQNEEILTHIWGLVAGMGALISWTWFAVANARFLKRNRDIPANEWTTLMGITNLIWISIFIVVFKLVLTDQFDLQKFITPTPELYSFLIGGAILGLLPSWVGAYCWNRACIYLPVSFAGQLMIFETIFGLLFVFGVEGRLPTFLEVIGSVFFFIAVAYSIRSFAKLAPSKEI